MIAVPRPSARRAPLVAALLVVALAAPASAVPRSSTPPIRTVDGAVSSVSVPRLSQVRVTTALGDSVPSGSVCGCMPFPLRVGALLQRLTRHREVVHDDAVGGLTAQGVLVQLRRSSLVRAHVAASDVVVVMVGANDVETSAACGTSVACYGPALRRLVADIDTLLDDVAALRRGRATTLVVVGYWNVWKDGAVARRLGTAYVRAGVALTRSVNAVLASVARADGALYVDTWVPFRGSTNRDDTWLLAADGDHPNTWGHGRIASAVMSALAAHLRP